MLNGCLCTLKTISVFKPFNANEVLKVLGHGMDMVHVRGQWLPKTPGRAAEAGGRDFRKAR